MAEYMLHDINHLAQEAGHWDVETFGRTVYTSEKERGLRTLEEALELAQSCGVFRDQAVLLLDHVYAKPKGNPRAEILDVFICLLVHADLEKLQLGEEITELQRKLWTNELMTKVQAKFEEKVAKGLTAFKVGELE